MGTTPYGHCSVYRSNLNQIEHRHDTVYIVQSTEVTLDKQNMDTTPYGHRAVCRSNLSQIEHGHDTV